MNRNLFLYLSLGLLIAGCSQKEDKPSAPATNAATAPAQAASSPVGALTTNLTSMVDQVKTNIPTAAISQAASNATEAASSAMAAGSNAAGSATSAGSNAMASATGALGTLGQFGQTAPGATPTNAVVLESPKAASDSTAPSSLLANFSTDQVSGALKEALGKGLQHAVASLGTQDGFLTNLNVKIPLPDKLQPVEKVLRTIGQGKLVDDFDTTMNRAAEQAVPAAAEVFASSLQNLSVDDAKAILSGPNDAATQYFRKATEAQLTQKFLPIVHQATASSGATAAYEKVMTQAKAASPFLSAPSLDLDSYVTGKAMDGLFIMVAAEEKRIRANPAAQSSQLLKSVFGALGK